MNLYKVCSRVKSRITGTVTTVTENVYASSTKDAWNKFTAKYGENEPLYCYAVSADDL
ncbi:hypothetical protein MM5_166 [Morganella phage vB_Mm5]